MEEWAAFEQPQQQQSESEWGSFAGAEQQHDELLSVVFEAPLERVFGSTQHSSSAVQQLSGLQTEWPSAWLNNTNNNNNKLHLSASSLLLRLSSLSLSASPSSPVCARRVTLLAPDLQHVELSLPEPCDWVLTHVVAAALNRGLVANSEDLVLVDASDEYVPSHTHVSALTFPLHLVLERRCAFLRRKEALLRERVAAALRRNSVNEADKAMANAWRVFLDVGTNSMAEVGSDEFAALMTPCSLGTLLVHQSLFKAGNLPGVSLHRNPFLPGVAMLHNLLFVFFCSDGAPHLMQLGKLIRSSQTVPVLLQQQPGFSRTLLEVLVEPDAIPVRGRIDATQFSNACLVSMLAGPASYRPSSIWVYLMENNSFGIEICATAAETSFSPFDTFFEGGEESVALCNILWMMGDEMSRPVPENVRQFWLAMEPLKAISAFLNSASNINDRISELFQVPELKSDTAFFPIMLRSGFGSALFNKLVLLQTLLRQNASCTHNDLLQALSPHLFQVYDAAVKKCKGVTMDVWRLLTKRTHTLQVDGSWLPNFQSHPADRIKLVCGDASRLRIDRLALRKTIEAEIESAKLIAQVLEN